MVPGMMRCCVLLHVLSLFYVMASIRKGSSAAAPTLTGRETDSVDKGLGGFCKLALCICRCLQGSAKEARHGKTGKLFPNAAAVYLLQCFSG